jgi:hypothetical protein
MGGANANTRNIMNRSSGSQSRDTTCRVTTTKTGMGSNDAFHQD